jgi:carbon storage regulator CsrA
MLVLSRKRGEAIELSSNGTTIATVIVTGTSKGATKLGISAPPEIQVVRTEIEQPQEEAA